MKAKIWEKRIHKGMMQNKIVKIEKIELRSNFVN